MNIVFIIGVVQAFFIEFLLINKRQKQFPDYILAVWMFFIGVHLFLHYLFHLKYHGQYPIILGLSVPLPLVHGPFLLLYVNALISKNKRFKKYWYLHFVPALSYYVALMPVFLMTTVGQLSFIDRVALDPPVYIIVYSVLIDLSGVIYISWSLINLHKHQKRVGDTFSSTDKINLMWLRNVIIGMAIIWIAVLAGNFLTEMEASNLIFGTVVLFVFIIGFFGIRQGAVFIDPGNSYEATKGRKYRKSTLSKEQMEEHLQNLLQFMEREKPYLESRLTLPQLAGKLQIHSNHLSQIINEKMGKNFYDFINYYRVKEFKRKLQEDNSGRLTILAHAYDSGFSSKSAFNAVFKNTIGMTPSAYLRQIKVNPISRS